MIEFKHIKVSIVIKALNEERHIARAVASGLKALESCNGELILADSVSSDRTVEIARVYPITIVQLQNAADRRCGVGPQLGYQYAKGDYVYILDGDMELYPDFITQALHVMENDPKLGGVAGIVDEQSKDSFQFRGRQRRNDEGKAGMVRWLDMGGLYRRAALEEVGYFSNRNLHSFEEQELGLRLSTAGWTLQRLGVPSVKHYGHTDDTFRLLGRRWRSRYLDGSGEMLRASFGTPYFMTVVMRQKHLLFSLVLWAWLLIALLRIKEAPVFLSWILIVGAVIGLRALRGLGVRDAMLGMLVWLVSAIALVRGLLTPQIDPRRVIASMVLSTPGNEGQYTEKLPRDAKCSW